MNIKRGTEMKKFFICFLVCFVAVLALNFSVYAISGDGTGENPFLIGIDGDILVIKSFPDKHYKLISDVNLNTSLGDFSGVLDGNGYKITSESKTNIIFASNSGTVKNLTANCRLAETSTESGIVENCVFNNTYCIIETNDGLIKNSKCINNELNLEYIDSGYINKAIVDYGFAGKNSASGEIIGCGFVCDKMNINVTSRGATYTFGVIACENAGKISECYSKFDMEYRFGDSTYGRQFCGIAINTDDNAVIENCFVIGNVNSIYESRYTRFGGIALSSGNVKNCYSAITGNLFAGDYYGVGGKNIENSYYMSASLSQDSTYGVSASETAMKMRALYTNWNFENVWGIDSSINDGFPYLRRFYDGSDLPNVSDYTINSLTITDENNAPLDTIPENSDCYAEVSVTKNTDRNEKDYIIIAMYDESGNLADVSYMRAFFIKDQAATFGKSFNTKGIKKIKSFIWSENLSLTPLSNYCVK